MIARSAVVCVDTHPLASVQSAATAIIVVVSFIVNAPPAATTAVALSGVTLHIIYIILHWNFNDGGRPPSLPTLYAPRHPFAEQITALEEWGSG